MKSHREAHDQQTTHGPVDLLRGDLFFKQGLVSIFGSDPVSHRHFQIEPLGQGVDGFRGPPIRHDRAGKAPFSAQHLVLERIVGSAGYPVELVVCGHHRPGTPFLEGFPEWGEINLPQRLLINHRIDLHASPFRVISNEVLHGGCDPFALQSPDPVRRNLTAQEGILPEVFKIAPVERRACNVHTRSKLDVDPSCTCLAAQCLPITECERGIPGRCKCDSRRKREGRTMSPDSLGPVSHH